MTLQSRKLLWENRPVSKPLLELAQETNSTPPPSLIPWLAW